MGKVRIVVDPKTGQNYLPRHVREDGFVGKVEGLTNAMTLIFIKPGADLGEIETSLRIILQDIALRRQQEARLNLKSNEGLKLSKNKASRTPHPLFIRYTRDWLHEVTGYSKGYLSRVATGRIALSRSFIERVCFKLKQPQGELFTVEEKQ